MEIPVVFRFRIIAISFFKKFTAFPVEGTVGTQCIIPGSLVDLLDRSFMLDGELFYSLLLGGRRITFLRFFKGHVEVRDDIFNRLSLLFQYFREMVSKGRENIFDILI